VKSSADYKYIKGVGKSTLEMMHEFIKTGSCSRLEELEGADKQLTAGAVKDGCFHWVTNNRTRTVVPIVALLIFCLSYQRFEFSSGYFGANFVDSTPSANSGAHRGIPSDHRTILVQRNTTSCLTPILPRHTFHVVIGGFEYLRNFEEHYIWDIGLPNIDIFVYRRTELEKPLRFWAGPCGAHAAEKLLVPNYGRDGAAFYDYIVENYATPPAAFAFLHGHVAHSWHTSCKALITRLTRYYKGLSEPARFPNLQGMVTLTSAPNGRDSNPFEWFGGRRRKLLQKEIEEVSHVLNRHNITLVDNGFASCCGTFILPGVFIRQHNYEVYVSLRELMMNQTLDDQETGRHGFEFIVYRFFTAPKASRDDVLQWYKSADTLCDDGRISRLIDKCSS